MSDGRAQGSEERPPGTPPGPQEQRPARSQQAPPKRGAQPTLHCPFCGGRRFDFGRDVYAGPDQLMYCRKTPAPGQPPEEQVSLPMKGAVCLDCGYVAMMVDLVQLRAPIRRRMEAASAADALARKAGVAAHLAKSPADEAAEALGKMTGGRPAAPGTDPGAALENMTRPGAEASQPAAAASPAGGPAEEGFDDLDKLLEDAERRTGIQKDGPAGQDRG